MNQKERVLSMLRAGPICSFEFYATAGLTHRLAARIYDLRTEGYEITARACTFHRHSANAVVYELVETDQLALPI